MNHLTSVTSGNYKKSEFDLASYFYSDSPLFKQIRIGETASLIFEVSFAIFLLLILSPALLLVAIAIKLFMKGDVLYSQVRVGKDGKLFKIYKFRTMVADAEAKTGAVFSTKNDPRVTTLGKFLRASHLDELPQLFNVLNGTMSFVGPRPERPEFVNVFKEEIPEYTKRHAVKPGITGLAQICLSYDAKAYEKIEFDLFYIENRESVILNVLISYYTALKMFSFFKNI